MLVLKNSMTASAALALLAFGFSVPSSFAQSTEPTVQDRKAVMQAQIELIKQEAELKKALQDAAVSSTSALPQVIAVFGLEGDLVARLQMANGLVSNYRVGETIRSGMTVASITPRQVSIAVGKGKAIRAVPLEFFAVVAPAAGGVPGIPGMPVPFPGGARPSPIPPELLPAPPVVRIPGIAVQTPESVAPTAPVRSAPPAPPASAAAR